MPFDAISYALAKKKLTWLDVKSKLESEGALNRQYDEDVNGIIDDTKIPDLQRSKIVDFFSSPFWDNIPDKPSIFPSAVSLLTVDADFVPDADATRWLGSDTKRWKAGRFSDSIIVGTPQSGAYRGVLANPGQIEIWAGDNGLAFIDFKTDYTTDFDARIIKNSDHSLSFYSGGSGSTVEALKLLSDGNVYIRNRLGINTTTPEDSLHVQGAGIFAGHVVAGRGSGGVALTHNDGYGNANVTFNHRNGVPEQDGNAARIVVNTDSTTNASMLFQLKSGVTGGVAVSLPTILALYETYIQFNQDLLPDSDNARNIGNSSKRLANLYAVNVYTGDLCFEEKVCDVCGGKFEEDDEIVLKVKAVDDYTRTVPIHMKCSKAYKELEDRLSKLEVR